ncbi:phospholipase B [Cyberlindnera jadinii NRRL Y-1542]|uniref:Lysophospholipase n=1 Tax=Cyberlindnera jadinii (strain ATCC 18201 / CBS 1600 / BCRC 20928 / JCM 3617 / NBRC 0987 / NRRL Y-1542) TaxID=983966 RepID=A0A1E4S018_CYBJN|nr:phospholipase B [Cyberlindnera jadinii NRRL Y-1542]ODV72841.1 phospholipase B [Cyberlindnera jadinii NRRL Y-1542]
MVSISTLLLIAEVAMAYNPHGYKPYKELCPVNVNLARPANALSEREQEWLEKRHEKTDKALLEFLKRSNLEDFDPEEFLSSINRSINIGLAFSGGGYRAMLSGAGQIAALDDRVPGALEHGLGGLLQSSTYLAGLSGGNWLTGSLALNNWSSVPELIDQGKWDLTHDIISPGGFDLGKTAAHRWEEIIIDVSKKVFAGYNISITDLWGRALAYQFFGEEEHGGLPLTYSDIREFESFKNAELPLPISLTVGRTPNTKVIDYDQSFFEFTPFELGSWDPNVYAFTDLKYIGSEVSNGIPTTDVCITGFDNAGFVLGVSSSLFNMFLVNFDKFFGKLEGIPRDVVHKAFEVLDKYSADISLFSPNPFYKSQYGNNEAVLNDHTLYLADGGSGWENIPFAPLVQPERDVDVIFAFDESSNTEDKFPSTNALNKTFERQFGSQGNGTAFPYIPTEQTYIKNKLYEKPLFLGCNSSDLTDLATVPPLVVYIPHQSFSAWSNTSTFQLAYSTKQRDAIIKNAFEATTRFNLTIDPDWPKCVSCAIVRREQERNDIAQTPLCQSCFQEYCWNGEQYEGPAVPLRTSNWTSSAL